MRFCWLCFVFALAATRALRKTCELQTAGFLTDNYDPCRTLFFARNLSVENRCKKCGKHRPFVFQIPAFEKSFRRDDLPVTSPLSFRGKGAQKASERLRRDPFGERGFLRFQFR